MKSHNPVCQWATDYLASKGYSLQHAPEIVLETPWSTVIRFSTASSVFFLKQTPPSIALEPWVMQLLANQFHASVPVVVGINEDLHCFLMQDAGQTLRVYLKREFRQDLLFRAIREFTTLQRSTERQTESFIALGVPDWRLKNLSEHYNQMVSHAQFLRDDGMTDRELEILCDLSPCIAAQCESLSRYQIPETFVQTDFNTNNILFDPNENTLTFIDLGEVVITHPFFSLNNFLLQAVIHHGVKETDQLYQQLQDACFEDWLGVATKNQLSEVVMLVRKLWPIYAALGMYRLMISVDLPAFKIFYATRPNRLAGYLREYAANSQ